MSKALSMLDMVVEAIHDKLCDKCKRKINTYRENLRKRKIKWIDEQFTEINEE